MANLDKSLELADALIGTLSNEEFKSILRKVKSLGIQGPTFEEYLSNFESEFDNLFNINQHADGYRFVVSSDIEFESENTRSGVVSTGNEISVVQGKSNYGTGFKNDDSNWSVAA